MIPRIYVDNSVISGVFDAKWQAATCELFRLKDLGCIQLVASEVTLREARRALGRGRLHVWEHFEKHFSRQDLLPLTKDVERLAADYISGGAATVNQEEDAQHVAVCTLEGIPDLVSCNFRHLVRPHRAAKFNRINLLHGLPQVRIISPEDCLYEY